MLVQHAGEAAGARSRADADEVDVGDFGIGLRDKADQESLDSVRRTYGETACVQMIEKYAVHQGPDGAAAPPIVDDRGDELIVCRFKSADGVCSRQLIFPVMGQSMFRSLMDSNDQADFISRFDIARNRSASQANRRYRKGLCTIRIPVLWR